MPEEDVGKLVRLKASAEAAAQSDVRSESAAALTQSYQRLREQMVAYLGERPEGAEFVALFPVNLVGEVPPNQDGGTRLAASTGSRLAEHASLLLRQMGGWIGGLLDAATRRDRALYGEEPKA
jgi:hypothetical protein